MNSHAEAALSRPSVSRRAVASRSASMGSTSAASPSRPPSIDSRSRPDLPKRARFASSYPRVAPSHTRGCERECRGAVRARFRRAARATAARRRMPPCPGGCGRAASARRCGDLLSPRDANPARLNERPATRGKCASRRSAALVADAEPRDARVPRIRSSPVPARRVVSGHQSGSRRRQSLVWQARAIGSVCRWPCALLVSGGLPVLP